MNADGSNPVNITNNPGVDDAFPSWSSDGSRILYQVVTGMYYDLAVINPDGTGKVMLTNTPSIDETDAVWSPSNDEIIFARGPAPYTLFKMNADGSGLTQLTTVGSDRYPCFEFRPK
jgi:TolB protein